MAQDSTQTAGTVSATAQTAGTVSATAQTADVVNAATHQAGAKGSLATALGNTHSVPDPQLINVEQVAEGWINKYVLTYMLPNGREFKYESVSRKNLEDYLQQLKSNAHNPAHIQVPDAVCIVPRTADNRLVLIKEFRYPLNSWCIAFPAGLIDPGEDIDTTVERELHEETGYALRLDEHGNKHIRALSQPGYSSAGMSEENVQVVYVHVENEPTLDQRTESVEYIDVFTIAMNDVPQF